MVMKQLIIFFFTVVLGLSATAQDFPVITFDSLTIDYGTVVKGENGIRQFKFTNTGTSELKITQVRSSCGCTIPKKPDAPIAPGASDIIEVKYDTDPDGYKYDPIPCGINCKNWENLVIKEEGVPY